MNIDKAINDVQAAESHLAKRLRVTGERHAVEHDLYHLGHTLARQSADHLTQLAPLAERYGVKPADPDPDSSDLLEKARHKTAELLGRSEMSGLLLLRDLRELYLTAQETEICWIILQQAARARRDGELTAVVTSCHAETETCAKWLRTRIKVTAPQALATG